MHRLSHDTSENHSSKAALQLPYKERVKGFIVKQHRSQLLPAEETKSSSTVKINEFICLSLLLLMWNLLLYQVLNFLLSTNTTNWSWQHYFNNLWCGDKKVSGWEVASCNKKMHELSIAEPSVSILQLSAEEKTSWSVSECVGVCLCRLFTAEP